MKRIILLFFLLILFSASSQSQSKGENYWPEIKNETKPWTRWWWLGSAVDEGNIRRLIKNYSEKGIGGVEITPIYGVKGEEENYIDFLSDRWVNMLDIAVIEANKNGMGVDMNTGTGWPFGGPHVSSEFASKKMQFKNLGNISSQQINNFINGIGLRNDEELIALAAHNDLGQRVNLLRQGASINDIADTRKEVIAVIQKNTGQKVKRAAPGGEGLVFNHFSKKSINHYLKRFDNALKGSPDIRSFFNDSYEIWDASSTEELFVTFKKLKGYDLSLYAKELSGKGNENDIARIKADYREVLGEMLLRNFTSTWTDWANKYGALSRNQAHGSPGNLIDLYAAVGIPELETFHATNFPFLEDFINQSDALHTESNQLFKKFASSAAHLKGEKLVSCETFTWLNEHFKTPLYQCKPELDELFVKGVTHLFFHGTTYSPEKAEWPGWLFYAATHMEPNNPQWEHIGEMNTYIARCQSVLQAGKHTNDFLVYWSPAEYNHEPEGLDSRLALHNSESWVNMPEVDELLEKGYQFDFITDKIIDQSEVRGTDIYTFGKAAYKTIVVPKIEMISLETFKKLLQLAENGATIVFNNLPRKVTGFRDYQLQEEELNQLIQTLDFSDNGEYKFTSIGSGQIFVGNIEEAIKTRGVVRETLIDYHVKNISRKTENGIYYFIANHEKQKIDKYLTFKHSAKNALFMDPMNGKVTLAESNSADVHIALDPGASIIVYFTDIEIDDIKKHTYFQEERSIELTNPWQLKALKGGPELFLNINLPKLEMWSNLYDIHKRFSGTGEYSTTFNIHKSESDDYLLRFEKVEASAKVFLNDKEVGTLWSFPFEIDVTDHLMDGENVLRVEVSNLGGNRIRHLDRQGVNWKKFHNINIVNLNYKGLNATNWGVLPSGLGGKVELITNGR